MTINDIFNVYYDLNINLLDLDSLKELDPKILKRLISFLGHNNIESFIDDYKKCMIPPRDSEEIKADKNKGETLTIYDLSVIAGASGASNYKEFKVWELLAFANGKNKACWGIASAVLAMVNNVHCTKQKDLRKPDDFNPTISDKEKAIKRAENARPLEDFI